MLFSSSVKELPPISENPIEPLLWFEDNLDNHEWFGGAKWFGSWGGGKSSSWHPDVSALCIFWFNLTFCFFPFVLVADFFDRGSKKAVKEQKVAELLSAYMLEVTYFVSRRASLKEMAWNLLRNIHATATVCAVGWGSALRQTG